MYVAPPTKKTGTTEYSTFRVGAAVEAPIVAFGGALGPKK